MYFKPQYYSSQFFSNLTVEVLRREMLHVMFCTEMDILLLDIELHSAQAQITKVTANQATVMLPCPWLYITNACNLWVSYQVDFPHRTCV